MADRAARAKKLAELKALRAGGKTRLDTYEVQQDTDLYEEVDEEGYKKVIRERLNQDDFVIDDNGEGYADDGREDWDRPGYASDSEDDTRPKTKTELKAAKRKREEDEMKLKNLNNGITNYFKKGAPVLAVKPKHVKTEEDDAFLADMLNEVDANVLPPPTRHAPKQQQRPKPGLHNQRRQRALSPPVKTAKQHSAKRVKTEAPTPRTFDNDGDDYMQGMDDDDDYPMAVEPSSPVTKAVERKASAAKPEADDEDDDMGFEVEQTSGIQAASVNLSGSRPAPKLKAAEPELASSSPTRPPQDKIDASAWTDVTSKLDVLQSSQAAEPTRTFGKTDAEDVVEADGSFNMFWTDYTEVHGSLCLFGKVKNKKTGEYVSAFLKIDNILRKLYFLPRTHRQKYGRATDEEVGMEDVYKEVDGIMTKQRVDMHKIKPCTRKYAFELQDVPKEAEYLKLLYPYTKPALSSEITGETFSHIFGASTALFEQFVLWKNVMGPCWLKIEDADYTALRNASHCKFEVQCTKPQSITALTESDAMDPPPLTLMSIAMRTTLNVKDNKQEILAISARIYDNFSLSETTPADKLPSRTITVMRPAGTSFPLNFENLVKQKARGMVKLCKQEPEMLSFFLAQLDRIDPDVILGHQLEGVDFSILLSRLQAKRTPSWSRIGRFKRSEWPKDMGRIGGSFFAERSLISGRLLCDLANDSGKSTMTKCQSWSLTEMCQLYLNGAVRREIDNEQALKSWATTKDGLLDYLSHMEADTYFIAALAMKVQMLPLTMVLTNLAGNSWARTLTGTRAERNEYILLHEFHRNKYICPDKATFKGKQAKETEVGEDDDATTKKDKYKGGLVFEPEKGLYDKFVLVMDFNSLYPSIIQEYNICFTTVDRTTLSEDEDRVPDVPEKQELGILPKLIATLVGRRKQVKSLMKDKTATPEQRSTWDIKQLALKLTANSMYGCLGYTKSRFYARPLAVLTTYKGREILRSTKELAESKNLQVIYGDTDSVMINANVDNVSDALKVGNEFKKAVNDSYKLLEIDIDNVFRRILLQAKKKYAAINLVEIDGKYVEQMEVKGLDMKRREYCALSKEVSSKLLNSILSGKEAEEVISEIHQYLREVAESMRDGKVPVQKYTIYTKLGKAPREYPNADSMPQVQVALRELAKGKTVRKDDVIAYIVADDGTKEQPAKRSYIPADVIAAQKGVANEGTERSMKPDTDWYLYKQIFPPVERLCANIAGTDAMHLAECLGLDVKKYSFSSNTQGGSNEQEIMPLESQIADEVRFQNATRLQLRCRACKGTFGFEGLLGSLELITAGGIQCRCGAVLSNLTVVAQLEHAIRQETARYYEGWLVCDDQACGNRTRQMSVYGSRCLGPRGWARGCRGAMGYEYGEKGIYNQLLYFTSLFDVEKAKSKATGSDRGMLMATTRAIRTETNSEVDKVVAMAEHNRVRFETLKGVVERYLDKCGRQWVAMDSLFGKIGITA